ncbi:MAG TPA: bifunctional 4-hydroxy-2-oxoglutarate aldolase/2-dehydro-3-deoxy-phosphogluconate aldolase [Trebonia sp.]|nr:bifunctional 4-hydroxy-2-oxoglutarate aldolase/2-dehydro-3-deoxy-phosphogluconate aldolase [Trebonia sp.]
MTGTNALPWERVPVIPVVVVEDAASAVPLAHALLAAGIDVMEITLRTAAAAEAITAVRKEVPSMVVGAGTLLTPADTERAVHAGAQFLVSPGSTAQLRGSLRHAGIPALPGIATVSEAMTALDEGFRAVKVFPARSLGGAGFIRALASVLPELRVCPTGGIDAASAAELLALPAVACVGGTWLTPQKEIAAGDYDRISRRAAGTLALRTPAGR